MTDDEQAFTTAAMFLLRAHRPPVTDALLAQHRDDHARLARASLPLLIALDRATYPADEVVRALRALAPDDLVEDPALGVGLPVRGNQTAFVTRTVPR